MPFREQVHAYLLSLPLGVKLLGQGVCVRSALTDDARPFSKVVPFVFLSTGYKSSGWSAFLSTLDSGFLLFFFFFFISALLVG